MHTHLLNHAGHTWQCCLTTLLLLLLLLVLFCCLLRLAHSHKLLHPADPAATNVGGGLMGVGVGLGGLGWVGIFGQVGGGRGNEEKRAAS